MKNIKYLIVIGIIILFSFNEKLNANDIKITGERWYNWDGSEWIQTQFNDILFDTEGNVTGRVDSSYTRLTKTWSCTYYDTCYTLYHHDSGFTSPVGWYENEHTSYNLNGTIKAYDYSYVQSDPGGGYTIEIEKSYTYSENKLVEYNKYTGGRLEPSVYDKINYYYDDQERIISEVKKTKISDVEWVDSERTFWTYEGDVGTGVTEEFRNTVWIFSENKIRNLNGSYQPITEESQLWAWGKFINNEKDFLYYNETPTKDASLPYQYLVDTQTYVYDELLETYVKDNRYSIYYENFTPLVTPENVTTFTSYGHLTLIWGAVSNADGYIIYSSNDPYGTYEIDTTGTFSGSTWSTALSEQKKFYKITSFQEDK
ncbi:MAG: hypothetical protein PF574_02005 [Candidatus Delongbacteria bacterium]|jgi:hypothetical protein|nr:hypothetical protein [Candidatus Delongbacteria bacterium]